MSKYRNKLPQLKEKLFLTDGGLETTLVFLHKRELPCFASFVLLDDEAGLRTLRGYFRPYLAIAQQRRLGFILETPTWRANTDWGAKLGYGTQALEDINRRSVRLMLELRERHETPYSPMVISGNIGPRGDGYRPDTHMSAQEARDYHAPQVRSFAQTAADLVSAFTLNYVNEAIGIALAAQGAGIPLVISFTVETNGHLPDGTSLGDAILQTDAATGAYAAYYMINCAHPTHFAHVLGQETGWRGRIRGIRANASCRSHAELDESTELDAGDPQELGQQYGELRGLLPQLTVLGGCCGTDHRHVAAVAGMCL